MNQQDKKNLFRKAFIIFIASVGFIVLALILIVLVFVCAHCSRPSRIHKQISIKYLASNELISSLEDSSSIKSQYQESIN